MPLERLNDQYGRAGLEGVRFVMRDGAKEVLCRVSLEALSDRGHTTGLNVAGVFESCRDEIEQVASAKYDRGQVDFAGGIYITSADFPSQRLE
jgi:hypothetical protein